MKTNTHTLTNYTKYSFFLKTKNQFFLSPLLLFHAPLSVLSQLFSLKKLNDLQGWLWSLLVIHLRRHSTRRHCRHSNRVHFPCGCLHSPFNVEVTLNINTSRIRQDTFIFCISWDPTVGLHFGNTRYTIQFAVWEVYIFAISIHAYLRIK